MPDGRDIQMHIFPSPTNTVLLWEMDRWRDSTTASVKFQRIPKRVAVKLWHRARATPCCDTAGGPSHVVRQGKTPVLEPIEARGLLDSIDLSKPVGLRDRALIGLMVYSFARIGAALAMKVEDVFVQNRRLWVRLREKGGKAHAVPCHHNLETYLTAYLEQTGLMDDDKGPLFRTTGRGTGQLTRTPLPQANAYAMIRRRAASAGIATKVGNHSFRATGITAYLKNGGTLEKAAQMANHASTRTTQLYDRRHDEMSLDEVERIRV